MGAETPQSNKKKGSSRSRRKLSNFQLWREGPGANLWHGFLERLNTSAVVWVGLGVAAALILAPAPFSLRAMPATLGLAVVAALLPRAVQRYWFARLPGRAGGSPIRDHVFLASLLLLVLILGRGFHLFAFALADSSTWLNPQMLAFGMPLTTGPLLAALFMGASAGMMLALVGGLLCSLMWSGAAGVFIYFLLTGMVAAHYVGTGRTRLSLLRASGYASLTGAAALLGLSLMGDWLVSLNLLAALAAAAFAGLVGGILALGLAPLVEMIFGYTTDSRLLELGSLDQPILQELMLAAPGTYHHSLMVGSLVEAAAREIGANHLLARVAALYHDIGKLKKPDYFVENQMGAPNPHDKLAPSMSALILISHLKEGVEFSRRHRLGRPITDIMRQHHGTRLIQYFYNRALEQAKDCGQNEPDPEAFRYPGPRPQTREAGLVMLADIAEAASRTLENPTPARIAGLVQTQINQVFSEGQLDECELTLKDLHKIAGSFTKILTGTFHHRVEYPGLDEKGKRTNGHSHRQPARADVSVCPPPGEVAGGEPGRPPAS